MKSVFGALIVTTALAVLASASGCARSTTVVAGSAANITPNRSEADLRINSVEVFGWRGKPQKSYVKIEKWKDSTDPNVPHPETLDLVCQLENLSDSSIQDGDFIALVTMEFIFAPTNLYQGDVSKIMDEVSWGRDVMFDDLKMEVVPFMYKGEKRQITFKGFNLRPLLKDANGADENIWPWALRANIHILNRDMVQVAQGQTVMPMIPSDKRLATR